MIRRSEYDFLAFQLQGQTRDHREVLRQHRLSWDKHRMLAVWCGCGEMVDECAHGSRERSDHVDEHTHAVQLDACAS